MIAPAQSLAASAVDLLRPNAELTVCVGRKRHPFPGAAAASRAYRATIEALAVGASKTPPCLIADADGRTVGHVSYNGRVWRGDGRDWKPGVRPVYDPVGGRF